MRVKIRRSQYEVRTTKIQHELSMTNSLWNSEGAQRGGSAKDLLHFVFNLEANLTLPFALGLSYKTLISYKPSLKKSPKTWTVSTFKKCMKSFSMLFLQPRENKDAVLLLSGEREPPVCPLQKAMEGKNQACQYIESPCSDNNNEWESTCSLPHSREQLVLSAFFTKLCLAGHLGLHVSGT